MKNSFPANQLDAELIKLEGGQNYKVRAQHRDTCRRHSSFSFLQLCTSQGTRQLSDFFTPFSVFLLYFVSMLYCLQRVGGEAVSFPIVSFLPECWRLKHWAPEP